MAIKMTQAAPVLFGDGASEQVGIKMKEFNATKVLCVFDEGVKLAGIGDKIVDSLMSAGLEVVIFDGVKRDAPDVSIDEGGELARREQVDGIVAVGGGSSMDTAKGIAVLTKNPGSIRNYLMARPARISDKSSADTFSRSGSYQRGVPLFCIPTTSGTGSEVSEYSIIFDTELHVKDNIIYKADFAIVDPLLTLTMPQDVTNSTGMDALAHACESMTTSIGINNLKTQVLGATAIKLLAEWLPIASTDGSNKEARNKVSLGSNLAGIAMNDSLSHLGHTISHAYNHCFGLSHGLGCALALAPAIELAATVVPENVKTVGEAMGITFAENATPEKIGLAVGDKIRDIARRSKIKSFKEMGITREEVVSEETIAFAMRNEASMGAFTRQPVTRDDIKHLLARAYDAYQ